MLVALLYEESGCIRGAALACEQQPVGDRFWFEHYADEIDATRGGCETAYVEITDPELATRLLAMQYGDGFPDGRMAAQEVERHLGRDPAVSAGGPARAA